MVVKVLQRQLGISLVELLLAIVLGAILMKGLYSIVKLGTDAQTAGSARNELIYQGQFALERITERVRVTQPNEFPDPPIDSTGSWFSPVMFCRNATNQLIEHVSSTPITSATPCDGNVIAENVTAFSAKAPANKGVVDRHSVELSLTLKNSSGALTLKSTVRLGGGML